MSDWLLPLVIIGVILLILSVGWGLFWFLVQAGIIVQKAVEPPTTTSGDYNLSQGREVKGEERQED